MAKYYEDDDYQYKPIYGPYDRIDTNPDNCGGPFYGKDDGEGHTAWYDSQGNLDCSTETPSDYDDDPYQRKLEPWERTHS